MMFDFNCSYNERAIFKKSNKILLFTFLSYNKSLNLYRGHFPLHIDNTKREKIKWKFNKISITLMFPGCAHRFDIDIRYRFLGYAQKFVTTLTPNPRPDFFYNFKKKSYWLPNSCLFCKKNFYVKFLCLSHYKVL